jgi:sugar phosphate isomerase/epimerase
VTPRYSAHQLCLPASTFADDVRFAVELGYDGLGIDVGKLGHGPDSAAVEAFRDSGLSAGVGSAAVWNILPTPNFPEPADPGERVALIVDGVRRLAAFGSESVFVVLGQPNLLGVDEAWRVVDDALLRIDAAAHEHGMTLSIEPMVREGGRMIEQPMVGTIEETFALYDRLGIDDGMVVADIWHLHDSPGFLEALRTHAHRISALQMNDFHPPRVWRDRLMPGAGQGHVRAALAALDAGGFDGWLDLEVFSDELWAELPPREFLARGLDAMRTCWDERASEVAA